MGEPHIDAAYYDGQTSHRFDVTVALSAGCVTVRGDGIVRHTPLHTVRISEPTRNGPRMIAFGDGAYCEISDATSRAALDAHLAAHGVRPAPVVRWQASWRTCAMGLLAAVAVSAAGYRWGVPWLADAIAIRLPNTAVEHLDVGQLRTLERSGLGPSQLDTAVRQRIEQRLAALHAPPGEALPPYHLLFRDAPHLPPNALALSADTIVVTDALVTAANGNDDLVIAVLAHELGHLHARHGLRMAARANMASALRIGLVGIDFSSVLPDVAVAGLSLKYSRHFETEADDYAVRLLLANGLSPALLADMLAVLTREQCKRADDAPADTSPSDCRVREYDRFIEYFSTHPDTASRIARLRRIAAQATANQGNIDRPTPP